MKKSMLPAALMAALAVLVISAWAAPNRRVARGKYLVEQVAMCGDCHTPHTPRGEPIMSRWLRGAELPFRPITPAPVWAAHAPDIVALPGWTEADLVKYLTTGIRPNGSPARPPMPQYRLAPEDAAAVGAYVRSLKTSTK